MIRSFELWVIIRSLKGRGGGIQEEINRGNNVHKLRYKGWLTDGTLRGEDLRSCNLMSYNLDDADFEGADLRGTYFSGSDLRRANFKNADLRGARFAGSDTSGANFEGAKFDTSTYLWTNEYWQPEAEKEPV